MNQPYFDHEKLDVYQAALDFIILVEKIIIKFPKGRGYLSDQLQRASSSVSLNIAEGAGEFSKNEKIRFYRMAKRSATECAGIIDVCWRLNLLDEIDHEKTREILIRIVSMLIRMAKLS